MIIGFDYVVRYLIKILYNDLKILLYFFDMDIVMIIVIFFGIYWYVRI